jgi:CPA1 family monovalent cation:H+ antiporter
MREAAVEPVTWVVLGVLAVVGVTSAARRVGVAPPLVLVVIGVAVSLIPAVPAIVIEPEIILALVLPPLLYSSAVSLPAMDFRRDLTTISALSFGLVVVSALVVGLVINALLPGVGLATGVALGAVVSPTDAVATRIVRQQKVSPRVVTVLEGESLLNDASALVLLRTAIAATAASVSAWHVVGDFVWAVAVAAAVGYLVGKLGLAVRSRLRPATAGVAISLVIPYVAYLPTEHLGGSGLVAAVAAGIVTGMGAPRQLRAEDRMTETAVWRTLELLLESAVFLVMGLELFGLLEDLHDEHGSLGPALGLGALTGAIVIAVRAMFVAPSLWLLNRRVARNAEQRGRLALFQERLDAAGGSPQRDRRPPHRSIVPEEQAAQAQRRVERLLTRVRRRIADIDYLATESFGWREGALLVWAGMRGAVTLAAAQSLPEDTPQRSMLVLVAFVVAAGTLLLQGSTLPALTRALGLGRQDDPDEQTDLEAIQVELAKAAAARLRDPALVRPDGKPYSSRTVERLRSARPATVEHPVPMSDEARATALADRAEVHALRLDLIATQRAALLRLRDEGTYASSALAEMLSILDAEQIGLELRASGESGEEE